MNLDNKALQKQERKADDAKYKIDQFSLTQALAVDAGWCAVLCKAVKIRLIS